MTSNPTIKAFVSHASEDKDRFVRSFAERLRANGVDAWLDEWEINPGESPARKIIEGLVQCGVVILIMSAKSIVKPWVLEELDAAFVRKVEGKARLIPIRLDECEMPECLKTTRWESVTDLENYDDSFSRILYGVFAHHERPPLGPPPSYANRTPPRIDHLNKVDSEVFAAACEMATQSGVVSVSEADWRQKLSSLQLSEAQLAESQQILEECGYIELYRTIGPHQVYDFEITLRGYHQYVTATMPDFNRLVDEIGAVLVRGESNDNHGLSERLSLPLRLVEHVLDLLENNGLIKIVRENGGYYMTVSHVSVKLRRAVDGN